MTLGGRMIARGVASGPVLRSESPLGFFGHLDPETGIYKEAGHPLDGKSVQGTVLVFPRAKGSTVGSYILYALGRTGKGPAAMVLRECDTITAVGAIIGGIPTADRVDIGRLKNGTTVSVVNGEVRLA